MWKKAVLVGLGSLGLGLLASEVIFPSYVTNPRASRVRVLAADVATMRAIFSQYTLDHRKHPQSLDEVVKAGYIKKIPPDPMSGRTDTWVLEWSDDAQTPGIVGIHSAVKSK
jgi:general secretion pathway protein G